MVSNSLWSGRLVTPGLFALYAPPSCHGPRDAERNVLSCLFSQSKPLGSHAGQPGHLASPFPYQLSGTDRTRRDYITGRDITSPAIITVLPLFATWAAGTSKAMATSPEAGRLPDILQHRLPRQEAATVCPGFKADRQKAAQFLHGWPDLRRR